MKKEIAISLGLFTMAILVDQLSKSWALSNLSVHFNKGIIFGFYSELPSSLRVISLCSFFGFIFFVYLILIYLLPSQLSRLKYGISLFTGGIFGNVLDKTFRGKAIDFIPFTQFGLNIQFNLADVIQWIGAAIIVYKVVVAEKIIWYPENQRGKFLVNPAEQIRFGLKFAAISICSFFLIGLFSFTFFRTSILENNLNNADALLSGFLLAYISLSLIFTLLVFFAGLIISHKTAGPLYAFELYVEDLLKGDRRDLVLRDGDNYRHLESIAQNLNQHFKKNDQAQ